MNELLFKDQVYKIIGAAMEVHKELKNGFLEPVYKEALAKEFVIQNILFEKESPISSIKARSLINSIKLTSFVTMRLSLNLKH